MSEQRHYSMLKMILAQSRIIEHYEQWRNRHTTNPLMINLQRVCDLETEREWCAMLDWCRLEKHLHCHLLVEIGVLMFYLPGIGVPHSSFTMRPSTES